MGHGLYVAALHWLSSEDANQCSIPKVALSYSADIWAFACCIFVVAARCDLVQNISAYQELCTSSIPEALAPVVDKFSVRRVTQTFTDPNSYLGAIVGACLKGDPVQRASAGSVRSDLLKELQRLRAWLEGFWTIWMWSVFFLASQCFMVAMNFIAEGTTGMAFLNLMRSLLFWWGLPSPNDWIIDKHAFISGSFFWTQSLSSAVIMSGYRHVYCIALGHSVARN